MPPNFICFFLSFFEHAPAKKTRDDWVLQNQESWKREAKQKEQKTRDGRLIKIEKREVPLFSLFSLLSLLSRKQEDG